MPTDGLFGKYCREWAKYLADIKLVEVHFVRVCVCGWLNDEYLVNLMSLGNLLLFANLA